MNPPDKSDKPAPPLSLTEAVKAEMQRRREAAEQARAAGRPLPDVLPRQRRKFNAPR